MTTISMQPTSQMTPTQPDTSRDTTVAIILGTVLGTLLLVAVITVIVCFHRSIRTKSDSLPTALAYKGADDLWRQRPSMSPSSFQIPRPQLRHWHRSYLARERPASLASRPAVEWFQRALVQTPTAPPRHSGRGLVHTPPTQPVVSLDISTREAALLMNEGQPILV